MTRQNNSKKKNLLIKIISTITTLGILVALILNSTQLIDRFKSNKVTQKNGDSLPISTYITKLPIKTPQVYKKEDVKEKQNERIKILIEEARRNKSISTTDSRNKYIEAYELLPESQKNRQFINSIKNSIISKDFGTQTNYLDSFFVSLKY
jgi:hypothetical protein